MPRAIGANGRVHMIKEVTYGTAPGGNWLRMPFMSVDLGAEQPLIPSLVLSAGNSRDSAPPFQDTVTVQGNAVVPIDLINTGHWLRMLFGAPTTTGTAPNLVHTFNSGAATLPSQSIEIAHPDVPNFEVCVGVRAGSLDIDFTPAGSAQMTIGLMGQGSTRVGTTAAGTPSSAVYTRFSQHQGSINRAGSPLAQVTGARMTFSNTLEMVRTIRNDRRLEGVDPGVSTITGQITTRFENTTLLTQAQDGTSAEFIFEYTINSNRRLTFTLYEVYLSLAKTPINGPAGVEATFDFEASFNATATRAMQVVLRNDAAGTVYA